ncbi:MAG TPA: carboxypeptidase-like regulatory domain-containing protein [Saprospiraceae bacterium]|nr:carboxypeptidase-like regulatory domain-containing protein [Saprospiraceae bacterium]
MRTIKYFLLLFILIQIGCGKDETTTPIQTFKGSLFVSLKDPDGIPVQGALIHMGNSSGTTDEDGNFFFTDIAMTGDDLLVAEKSGYFKGSRRFRSAGPQTQFIRITLLNQEEKGVFASSQATTISIDNKSKLHFPDHAIVREDGSAYNGNVHVMANPIYGNDTQLSNKMPGNLVGIDASDTQVALGSLGMIAVELRSDSGEKLQVATGKSVEMELAIANNQLDKAPASVPLWSFDEDKGYWVEEGVATRQGNFYVAQLTHFSFWNCDDIFTLTTNWTGRFVYQNGDPAQNINICLTIKSLNSQVCALTDANGLVSGLIPADEPLEVSVENECGGVLLSFDVASASELVPMDLIKLNEPTEVEVSTIQGTAMQCDGLPITSGFAKVFTGSNLFIFPIKGTDGHYEGSFEHCTGDLISLQFVDAVNGLESSAFTYSAERNMNVGILGACNQVEEFIRYKIKGFSTSYNYYLLNVSAGAGTYISTLDSIGLKGKFGFSFDGSSPGDYKAYLTFGNQVNLPNGQTGYFLHMNLQVTEFGSHNEFIRGTMTGKLNVGGNGAGGNGDSDVTGEFAVRNR